MNVRKDFSYLKFQQSVVRWYQKYRRQFPWRSTNNPYRILLSEIMLQQTQASRVVEFYKKWLKKFPTFFSLSKANTGDVLRLWSGLGYNNRALRFHQLAKIVVDTFHSRLPRRPDELQQLPGVGKYTSHAVACFAFQVHLPLVDVNIQRVLTRITRKVKSLDEMIVEKEAWRLAEIFLPKKNAHQWNQAFMELGALVCTARIPKCSGCPVHTFCTSAFSSSFNKRSKKIKVREPSWKGIPRRLYRGKILKLLHHHSFNASSIAAQLWNNPTDRDVEWLESILNKMQSDGLIEKHRNNYRISE